MMEKNALFMRLLELSKQITELQQEQAEVQQKIAAQHLEQEYQQFKNFAWLPKEQQERVNKAISVRASILAERDQQCRQELVAQFALLEVELEQENLVDDYLCGWNLAQLLKA